LLGFVPGPRYSQIASEGAPELLQLVGIPFEKSSDQMTVSLFEELLAVRE
jgi:hypothetical protein